MNIYLNTHSCKYYTFSCRRKKSFFHYISQAKWHWRACGIIEAKRENSFPFCDECTSDIYSGESASLVLLDNIHHYWQITPDDTLLFMFLSADRLLPIPSAVLLQAALSMHSEVAVKALQWVNKHSQANSRKTCTCISKQISIYSLNLFKKKQICNFSLCLTVSHWKLWCIQSGLSGDLERWKVFPKLNYTCTLSCLSNGLFIECTPWMAASLISGNIMLTLSILNCNFVSF